MSDKKKFPRAEAMAVACSLRMQLEPFCERIVVAGSLRREKPRVGDIELLLIPKFEKVPATLFETGLEDLAAFKINELVLERVLERRKNVKGFETWGPKNKLAVHVASGIPVDCFSTTVDCWWNALVCRTGGKQSNQELCSAALAKGWRFEAYGSGFRKCDNSAGRPTTSERDVFEFVGLPYLEPKDRK